LSTSLFEIGDESIIDQTDLSNDFSDDESQENEVHEETESKENMGDNDEKKNSTTGEEENEYFTHRFSPHFMKQMLDY
jgi:hypothetical protein